MSKINVVRTHPHESYTTDIRDSVIKMNWKNLGYEKYVSLPENFPYSLVRDLAHSFSYVLRGEDPRKCLKNPESWPSMSSNEKDYHRQVQEFVTNINFPQFSGATPLQKACNVALFLMMQDNPPSGSDSNGEGKMSMVRENGGGAAKNLNSQMEAFNKLNQEEQELLMPPEENTMEGVNWGKVSRELKAAQLTERQKNSMELGSRLKTLDSLKAKGKRKLVRDEDGKIVKQRPMDEISEVVKGDKINLLKPRPILAKMIMDRDIWLDEKWKQETGKLLLYMLIDKSGSMSSDDRIANAVAVLRNRLDAVMRGEAELYVRFFESDLYEEVHVKTKDDARRALRMFGEAEYDLGGTDVGYCIHKVIDRIGEIKKARNNDFEDVEIMIVNDGDDYVDEELDLKGAKLHAVVVTGRVNPGLKKLANKSGGIYMNIK